jgi:hypothetical protein
MFDSDRTEREELAILRNRIAMMKSYETEKGIEKSEVTIYQLKSDISSLEHRLKIQQQDTRIALVIVAIFFFLLGLVL